MTAWDGTAREFWDAVGKHRAEEEIEGDAAVLAEVLALATNAHSLELRLKAVLSRLAAVRDLPLEWHRQADALPEDDDLRALVWRFVAKQLEIALQGPTC